MEIKINSLPKSKIELVVVFSVEDLLPFKDKSLEELGKSLKIDGFRMGKAPLDLVEKHFPAFEIYEKMTIFAIEKHYPEIIQKNKIEAIGPPQITITKIIPNSAVEFKSEVAILPKIILPDYKAIAENKQKDKKEIFIKDEEIDEALKWLRQSRQEKEKDLPELNDDFAKSLGKFENLNDLKQGIKDGLIIEKTEKEKERWRLDLIDEITSQSKGEIPDILTQAEMEKMLDELKINLDKIHLPLPDYLSQIKKTEEELKKDFEPLAEKRVKIALILKGIAEQEKITVAEEEIAEKANRILLQLPDPALAQKINHDDLKAFALGLIKNEKGFELLEKRK